MNRKTITRKINLDFYQKLVRFYQVYETRQKPMTEFQEGVKAEIGDIVFHMGVALEQPNITTRTTDIRPYSEKELIDNLHQEYQARSFNKDPYNIGKALVCRYTLQRIDVLVKGEELMLFLLDSLIN